MADAWRDSNIDDLCDALLVLRSRDEAAAFLRDICSLHELESLSHRWHAARLVHARTPRGRARRLVPAAHHSPRLAPNRQASPAPATRVAPWLNRGGGGSGLVLERLEPPCRAGHSAWRCPRRAACTRPPSSWRVPPASRSR